MSKKEVEEKVVTVGKARYWWGVLYPDNMVDDWATKIAEILQLPFAYCIHDDDLEAEFEAQEREQRKVHVHLIVAFPNTTTYNHAFKVFSLLNANGKRAINKIEAIRGVRHAYEYLIHNTESSKKEGKVQYSASKRICGNNFDIGAYEQISSSDKLKMSKDICNIIINEGFLNFADLYMYVISNMDDSYFETLQTHSGFYERILKGNYLKKSNLRDFEK